MSEFNLFFIVSVRPTVCDGRPAFALPVAIDVSFPAVFVLVQCLQYAIAAEATLNPRRLSVDRPGHFAEPGEEKQGARKEACLNRVVLQGWNR